MHHVTLDALVHRVHVFVGRQWSGVSKGNQPRWPVCIRYVLRPPEEEQQEESKTKRRRTTRTNNQRTVKSSRSHGQDRSVRRARTCSVPSSISARYLSSESGSHHQCATTITTHVRHFSCALYSGYQCPGSWLSTQRTVSAHLVKKHQARCIFTP